MWSLLRLVHLLLLSLLLVWLLLLWLALLLLLLSLLRHPLDSIDARRRPRSVARL